MGANEKNEKIIREEQKILEELIDRMDIEMLHMDERLTRLMLEARKAKEKCLPDTYGDLLEAQAGIKIVKEEKKRAERTKDELYENRMVVNILDYDGATSTKEYKVGLHTYSSAGKIFVCSWLRPVCRHFILDNRDDDFEGIVTKKRGECYKTKYSLVLKRKVELRFTQVKDVTHLFPLVTEEEEDIIADEFLRELAKRRNEAEFKNIVFSIQKQQGEIIQAPFIQNMIVQGCAGSGKSMIMLHRLPIILYDNPHSLSRTNLYIITPSLAYIQMAEEMRYQLEIEDLQMGTLEQYYNLVIERYGREIEEYGRINPSKQLEEGYEKYIYSTQFVKDIQEEINTEIDTLLFDYAEGVERLGINKREVKTGTAVEVIRNKVLQGQAIVDKNIMAIRAYYSLIRSVLSEISDLRSMCVGRKLVVTRSIDRKISKERKTIEDAEKEITKLNPVQNAIAIEGKKNIISDSIDTIERLLQKKIQVEADEEYFEYLDLVQEEIDKLLYLFEVYQENYEQNTWEMLYKAISMRNTLLQACEGIDEFVASLEERYLEYAESLRGQVQKIIRKCLELEKKDDAILDLDYFSNLQQNILELNQLNERMVSDTYMRFMGKIGQVADQKGKLEAIKSSPYMYLQILYAYYGSPNGSKESLITIDEAQGLAPEEFKLIRKVNNNRVVLNLFGDERQHIEGTKGIDRWDDLLHIVKFEQYNMRENYRNARQITEYCNRRFAMDMHPINLDGEGVHEITGFEHFKDEIITQFINVQKQGISAIIVKTVQEAQYLKKIFKGYETKLYDLTVDSYDIHRTRWNLMTVDEAKGLEFGSVIAVTGNMTQNEKYITYTRALNELWVFDEAFDIHQNELHLEEDKMQSADQKGRSSKKKREKKSTDGATQTDFSESRVRKFFEDCGLKVVDQRPEGKLWIIGEKESIKSYVDEAVEKFGVTGSFGSDKKLGFRFGWSTKTKK